MEEKKGRVPVMAESAIVVIWFASIIAGMVLTMLMPKIFAESPANEVRQGEAAHAPSLEMLHVKVLQERKASMVLVEEEV